MDSIIHTTYPEFLDNSNLTTRISAVSAVPVLVNAPAEGVQGFLNNRGLDARIRIVSSSGLGFIIFANDQMALRAQKELKRESGLSVDILSNEAWMDELNTTFEEESHRINAAHELDDEIARLQNRINEAGKSATISTKHALHNAKKQRAALPCVNLHERHVQTLKETLESPLWPSTIDSIRAVILQLETYDPVLCDPRRDFRIIYHKGSVVAAIKGDNGDLQEEMEHELSEALGLNLTDLCLWEEWPLMYIQNELLDMNLTAIPDGQRRAGHWKITQTIKCTTDIDGVHSASLDFLLDSGCTEPLGHLSDIDRIDPQGQLPQAGSVRVLTSNGAVVDRPYYWVDLRINCPAAEGEGSITHWRRTLYKVAPNNIQRLSGLFPFKHTYLAKGPGNMIKVGNQKTKVAAGMVAGQGDI